MTANMDTSPAALSGVAPTATHPTADPNDDGRNFFYAVSEIHDTYDGNKASFTSATMPIFNLPTSPPETTNVDITVWLNSRLLDRP